MTPGSGSRAGSWDAFCRTRRIRWKDRRVHPGTAPEWPGILAIDGWDRDRLLALQSRRLEALLSDVVTHVPFYRAWARDAGLAPGDPLRLADFPVVTKADYRRDLEAFQSERVPPSEMVPARTSGSSGEPFRFRTHRAANDYSYGVLWRALRRHGLAPGDRRVYVWGTSWKFGLGRRGRLAKRARLAARDVLNSTLAIDAYRLTHREVDAAVRRIERFRPRYLHGYVSALYTIARHLADRGRVLDAPLALVVTESEALYPFQRAAMEAAFPGRVVEHYGSVEMGNVAQEDPDGHLRIAEDLFAVETAEGGELQITNLFSGAFPFIRFRLGDLVELAPDVPPGLPYARFARIVGRTVDLVPVPRGGFVHGVALAHVIDRHLAEVLKYQVRQRALDRFEVRLVVRDRLPESTAREIAADLRALVGESARVDVTAVDRIEPAESGKFRWVISDVAAEPRQGTGSNP